MDGEAAVLELEEGRSVLGAGASADLHVAAPGLADEHVVFERSGAAVVAAALAPLRHNGSPASRAVLASGDELVVGGVRLRFVASGDAIVAKEQDKEAGVLWWMVGGWAVGYLGVFLLVTAGLIGPAAAGPDAMVPAVDVASVQRPPTPWLPEERAGGAVHDEAMSSGLVAPSAGVTPHLAAAAPNLTEPAVEKSAAPPVAAETRAAPARAVAALPRVREPALRPPEKAPAKRIGRAVRREDLVERMVAAWKGGAIEDVVALGEGSAEVEVHRLATLARRFATATERARRTQGIAAAPALEEALGIAEEIGRDAPPVQEVRRALAALHRSAARRAEARGDLEGAVHHCEQALAVRPGDSEAKEMRRSLAERARPIYLDGYALQHLDPTAALRLFERASLLALPGDPTGARAAALAVKMRTEAAGGRGADGL